MVHCVSTQTNELLVVMKLTEAFSCFSVRRLQADWSTSVEAVDWQESVTRSLWAAAGRRRADVPELGRTVMVTRTTCSRYTEWRH